jgi:hypothetical protein
LNLESRSIRIMCFYYLYKKYDNSISIDLSHFKITLHKIESIKIYFLSGFLINIGIFRLGSELNINFFMLRTKIVQ